MREPVVHGQQQHQQQWLANNIDSFGSTTQTGTADDRRNTSNNNNNNNNSSNDRSRLCNANATAEHHHHHQTGLYEMPCWYFDKKELRDTPTIQDGISFETERRYRKEGARFIMTCGTQMSLGHNTMATGVVYFHRFYMFHSFKSFPRYVTACCCLLLAGKVEETPKKCRDIIRTARALLSDNYFYSFGEDPKEEVMTLERILLQTIKFDLQVEHPYTFLLKYAKCIKGDQTKLQKMVQMAWNFVNDSLSTVVCLQWEPEIIAVALIHLASKLSKFVVVDWVGRQSHHLRWWDMFVSDVTMEILEDICHQVLDLYQSNQKEAVEPPPSPPQKPPSRADSPTPVVKAAALHAGSGGSNASNDSPAGAGKTGGKATGGTAAASAPATGISTTTGGGGELNNIQAIKSLANSTPSLPAVAANIPSLTAGVVSLADPNALGGGLVGGGGGAAAAAAAAAAAVAAAYHHHHMYSTPMPPQPPMGAHPQMHPAMGMYAVGPAPPPPPPHGYGAPPCPGGVGNGTNANSVGPPPLPLMVGGGGGGVNVGAGGVYGGGPANQWASNAAGNSHHYTSSVPPPPMPPGAGNAGPGGGGGGGGYYQGGQGQGGGYGRQQRY